MSILCSLEACSIPQRLLSAMSSTATETQNETHGVDKLTLTVAYDESVHQKVNMVRMKGRTKTDDQE